MSKENPKFGRRDFLRMAGLTAAGVFFSSCALKEPTPQSVSGKSEPTPEPTKVVFPTAEPSPTPLPTEAPKPTPTETLKQKWGKVWVIGEGMGTGGPESGLTKGEERFGNFIEQITKQLEAKGESLKQTELFVGAFPRPEVDAKGKPKLQSGELNEKNSILCAYIFGKTGKKEVYCATEGEKGKEAQVGKISDIFTPEEKIWGGCQEKVDGSVVVSCADGTTYKTEKTVFGADLTKLISEKETMTGYLFTAVAFQQKELSPSTFFLSIKDQKKLPPGKEGIDIDKFIPAFDLASARFNVWESNPEKDNPYVGNWDLEKGEWRGEQGYEDKEGYQKLFVESNLLLELDKAPEIAGLKASLENEKIVYRAKAGNPYKLEAGNYAGEVVHYVINQKSESGLGLNPSVLEVLLRSHQYQTSFHNLIPENYIPKEEKIPLPFDPRNVEFGIGEVKYTRKYTQAMTLKDGTIITEAKYTYLGLDLPVGTTIYCPVEKGLEQAELVSYYMRNYQLFSSKEREAEFSEECLREGLCEIDKYTSSKGELKETLHERPKTIAIQPKDQRLFPFKIIFPWDSQVAQAVFEEIKKNPKADPGGEKKVFLGAPLFVVDINNKPAVKFAFPCDYPILLEGRPAPIGLDNLFKIDGRLVFILPSS